MALDLADEIKYLPDAPQADHDLDMRLLRASVMQDEGELVLILTDGYATVAIEPGLSHQDDCINRAEKLAAAALSYAELMRARLEEAQATPGEPEVRRE